MPPFPMGKGNLTRSIQSSTTWDSMEPISANHGNFSVPNWVISTMIDILLYSSSRCVWIGNVHTSAVVWRYTHPAYLPALAPSLRNDTRHPPRLVLNFPFAPTSTHLHITSVHHNHQILPFRAYPSYFPESLAGFPIFALLLARCAWEWGAAEFWSLSWKGLVIDLP